MFSPWFEPVSVHKTRTTSVCLTPCHLHGPWCPQDTCEPDNEDADATTGCVHTPLDDVCADDFSCTSNVCNPDSDNKDSRGCVTTPISSRCDDGHSCTDNVCSPTDEDADADGCVFPPVNSRCDDGYSCTDNVCNPDDEDSDAAGCVYPPVDSRCDDGIRCVLPHSSPVILHRVVCCFCVPATSAGVLQLFSPAVLRLSSPRV